MEKPNDAARVGHRAGMKPRWGRTTDMRKIPWSKALKDGFLDHLAATCNVCAAARAIGVDPGAIYPLRRRDEAFAESWSAALAAGYEMLETRLVGHALAGGGQTIADGGAAEAGAIDVDLALRLLTTHRAAMLGKPFNGGRRAKTVTPEETNAAILKKLKVVEARLANAADAPAADAPAGDGNAREEAEA